MYSADPKKDKTARLIPQVDEIDDKIRSLAGGAGSSLGTGGMATKIHAAEICTASGIDMIIARGDNPDVLYDICEGKGAGTRFIGKR